ncbi:MAG: hypothetical protein U5K00_05480 [Melioribacteraceae bacterium]|nr:hypothetical protein [Melioribacteraceae bacterium]
MKIFFLLLVVNLITFAQLDSNWVLVSSAGNSTTYMETKDLNSFRGDDIYVWVMEKHNPPIIIESVDGRIYKTKTYYLINKRLQRYSLLQIIYYNENDDVLKSFSYNRKTNISNYQYNFPVMRGSNEEVILQKIFEVTGVPKKIKEETKENVE